MSVAQGRYERMGCLFNFAQTALSFRLKVNGARRPACPCRGVRQTSHSEFRGVADAEEGQLR